jgi:thiol-disulfide isomerase/thioredoxin
MTEISGNDGAPQPQDGKRKGGDRRLTLAILAVLGIGALAALYVIVSASMKPGSEEGLSTLARGEMAKLVVAPEDKPAPTTTFVDASGKKLTLKDFEGQVAVVNLWATWCGPCKIEMPTLAKLQSAYANKPVRVVAISVDRAEDAADARKFIAQHAPLGFYHDPAYALAFALDPRVEGLPTTIIYGRNGKEAARLPGDTDWASPDARAVIDKVLVGG